MLKLTVPTATEYLLTITDELSQFGQDENISAETLQRLNLIVEELFVNVVNHGSVDDNGSFQLEIRADMDALDVTIVDSGAAFDPDTVAMPDTDASLAHRTPGGLGLHLVRQLSENFSYQRCGERNVIRLVLGR